MFCAAPKGLAAEGYFYGPDGRHATVEAMAIENWLATEIEGPGADAITRLLAKQELSGQRAHAFFRFVAAQLQRTPASLQRTADNFAPIFQEMAQRILKYHPEARANIIADVKATGATDEEVEQLIRIMDEGQITTTPTREFTIARALQVWGLVAHELAQMKWTFAGVPKSDGDLILGDHPVTLADVGPTGTISAPLGVKNPHIEIAMPLSPRMVALAHWDGPICYSELVPGMAEMLNVRTLSQIQRFAYASFESNELLDRAAVLRGTGPKMRTHRVQVGEQLIMVTEFR